MESCIFWSGRRILRSPPVRMGCCRSRKSMVMPRRNVQITCVALLLFLLCGGLVTRHYMTQRNANEIRYGSGEVARVGDRVDDNGEDAVVERIHLTAETAE